MLRFRPWNELSNLSYDEEKAETYINDWNAFYDSSFRKDPDFINIQKRIDMEYKYQKDLENVSINDSLLDLSLDNLGKYVNPEDEQEHPSDMIQLDYDYFWKRHKENINLLKDTEIRKFDNNEEWTLFSHHNENELIQTCTEFHEKNIKYSRLRNRDTGEDIDINTLNPKQRKFYDIVLNHRNSKSRKKKQLLMILLGTAGTGKSYVIKALKDALGDELEITAPTGMAAFNVNGVTIHSLLGLPIQGVNSTSLSVGKKKSYQKKLTKMKYLIIDEFSMIGLKTLYNINNRLKDIKSKKTAFGGINVILIGDIFQISPVQDKPLFQNNDPENIKFLMDQEEQARLLYLEFKKVVIFTQNVRQQGEETDQRKFRKALDNIRVGSVKNEDYEVLQSRMYSYQVDPPHRYQQIVDNCIHLYFKKINVRNYNWSKLTNLKHEILKIDSVNNNKESRNASMSDAMGLEKTLYISKGSAVLLTTNICAEVGLCNGARGTVYSILYRKSEIKDQTILEEGTETYDYSVHIPQVIFVDFPKFVGKRFCSQCPPTVVPIFPKSRSWTSRTFKYCSRIQFPLTLSYAMTVHKSQGQTFDQCYIDLGREGDFANGLSFVALSRIKKFDQLVVRSFSKDRLFKNYSTVNFKSILKEYERLKKYEVNTE